MKKKFLIYITAFTLTLGSCKYMDIVPDATPNMNDAFKNESTAEGFLYTCYSFIPRYNDARTNFSWIMSNETAASYHWGSQYFTFLQIQQAQYSADNPVLDIWQNCYKGIRQCYLFLDNVDKTKPITISAEELEAKKKVWRAEAKYLIAYFHYVLLQNYGPIVLVDKLIPTDATGTEFFKPRSPYDECVTFIANKFDEASADLPNTIVNNGDLGRVTRIAAQSLKSRMFLYAASPLFNGNVDYANFKNPDGKQLTAQSYDKEKWKKALDETKKAIDQAEGAGYKLYEYNKTAVTDPFKKAVLNTRWQMVDPWNSELIWGYSGYKEDNNAQYSFQTLAVPRGWRSGSPVGGVGATLDAVELFYSKNGVPTDKDPTYNYSNRFTIANGDSTIQFHRNREPRFYAYIGFDRGEYEINDQTRILKLRAGELNGTTLTNGTPNLNVDHLYTGYAIKKGIHPSTNVATNAFTVTAYPFPIIRLGELYLNYAEAYANYYGTLDATALGYLNKIRTRAGIPGLEVSYGGLPTGAVLIEAIHRERLIEFMFEGHSLYDRKRWKTAVSDYSADRQGMKGLTSVGKTATDFYKPITLSGRPLIFEAKQYLVPINVNYIKIKPNLVQNPGW